MLFNAGCNKQVLSPKPRKKILAQIRLVVFKKTKKTHTLILKMTSPSRRLQDYATLITI